MLLLLYAVTATAQTPQSGEEAIAYEDKRFLLGLGVGIVRFDTNAKVTSKETGRSRFVDLEGDLGLPDDDRINTIYGSWRFNRKHSVHFSYFNIDRESDLIGVSQDFGDLVTVNADIVIKDTSRFFSVAYGYTFHEDDRSDVTLVAGLKNIDLRMEAEVTGEVIVGGQTLSETEVFDADVLAPLPLFGLNLGFDFTEKWSVAARVGLVTGSYQDTSALVVESTINAHYRFTDNVGLLTGLTYFNADVEIDDDDEETEITYGYIGLSIGLHLGF